MRFGRSLRLNRIVRKARKRAERHAGRFKPRVAWSMHYGAIEIDPKNLAVWYVFKTEANLSHAREYGLTSQLDSWTRHALAEFGYPRPSVSQVRVSSTSDESIDAAGGFRAYFA